MSKFFVLALLVSGSIFAGTRWLHSHSGNSSDVSASPATVATAASSSATADNPITDAIAPPDVHAAESLPLRANFVSAFDGQVTGAANRDADRDNKAANYHLLVYLPGLDPTQETYAVWLLKDGLADVKRMGELSARSDGSWTLDFTAGPTSGIASTDAYRTVVIMKELKGTSESPSGTKMATASF